MQFLRTPFKAKALDVQMSADFYYRNGLRVIGARVGAPIVEIQREVTKLKGRLNLSPALAERAGIGLGYAPPSDVKSVLASLDRLSDPKALLLNEIFWLPLDELDPEWQQIKGSKSLQGVNLDRLRSQAKSNSDMRASQALAVALHNRAIAADCDWASGGGRTLSSGQLWPEALHWWSVLLSNRKFWEHLDSRITAINHINLRREHLEQLRKELPRVILGFNEAFAQHYALSRNGSGAVSNLSALQQHLAAVSGSALDVGVKSRALSAMAGEVIQNELAAAASEFDAALATQTGFIELARFRELADKLLNAMEASYQLCRQQFTLGTSVFEWCTFDSYCDKLHKSTNSRIEWKGDSGLWEKKIYYGAVVFDRMLALPLSAGLRASIADDRNKHLEHLWGGGAATVRDGERWRQCFFVPGQQADFDSVVLRPYYRSASEDMFDQRWKSRYFLVPRSSVGRGVHAGTIKASKLLEDIKNDPALSRRLDDLKHKREQDLAAAQTRRDAERARLNTARPAAVLGRDTATKRLAPSLKRIEDDRRKATTLRDARVKQAEIELEAGCLRADAMHECRAAELRSSSIFFKVFGYFVYRRRMQRQELEHSRVLDGLRAERDRKKRQADKDFKLEGERLDAELAAEKRKSGIEAAEGAIAKIDSSLGALDAAFAQEARKCESAFEDGKLALVPKIRPESEWKEFPTFRGFLADGFKEGTRPPEVNVEREMERLMQRLTPSDRALLAHTFREDSDIGAEIVKILIQNRHMGVLDALQELLRRRGH